MVFSVIVSGTPSMAVIISGALSVTVSPAVISVTVPVTVPMVVLVALPVAIPVVMIIPVARPVSVTVIVIIVSITIMTPLPLPGAPMPVPIFLCRFMGDRLYPRDHGQLTIFQLIHLDVYLEDVLLGQDRLTGRDYLGYLEGWETELRRGSRAVGVIV